MKKIRMWLGRALSVLLPFLTTLLCAHFIWEGVVYATSFLPSRFSSGYWIGSPIGVLDVFILTVLLVFFGALISSQWGVKIVSTCERVLSFIPVFRTLYRGVKEGIELFFTSKGSFDKVVLVEYPRRDCWSIAFMTNAAASTVNQQLQDWVTVFVPTTPNPSSGFVLMVKREDVRFVNVDVEDALRFVISLGASGSEVLSSVVQKMPQVADADKQQ